MMNYPIDQWIFTLMYFKALFMYHPLGSFFGYSEWSAALEFHFTPNLCCEESFNFVFQLVLA